MDEGLFRRRRLPHWDVCDATYFVTSCLAGSIPAAGLAELNAYRDELGRRPRPNDTTAREWEARKHKLLFARLDDLLDHRPAVRHLEYSLLADIVEKSLQHFDGSRYDLLGYVVMPSHIHWLFKPRNAWWIQAVASSQYKTPREHILQAMKSFTAHACNKLMGWRGAFGRTNRTTTLFAMIANWNGSSSIWRTTRSKQDW